MTSSATKPNGLTAARAGIGVLFCAALGGAALALDHPAALAGVIVAVMIAGAMAGHGKRLVGIALLSLPLALTVGLVNALVSRQGESVVWRLGSLPFVGRIDITAQALIYSGVLVLRVEAIILAAALFTACVDQDALLRLMRRRSGRFGLAVGLAARLAPLLARDGRSMAQARKTLDPSVAAPRAAIVEAVAMGALDRAVDAAAALELRGLGDSPCLAPENPKPWSRHDRAFAICAFVIAAVASVAALADWTKFSAGAQIHAAGGGGPWIVGAVIILATVAPMVDRRGTAR